MKHTYLQFLEKFLEQETIEDFDKKMIYIIQEILKEPELKQELTNTIYNELLHRIKPTNIQPEDFNIDNYPQSEIIDEIYRVMEKAYQQQGSKRGAKIVTFMVKYGPSTTNRVITNNQKITTKLFQTLKPNLNRMKFYRYYEKLQPTRDTNNDLINILKYRDFSPLVKFNIPFQDQTYARHHFEKFDVEKFKNLARDIKHYEIYYTEQKPRQCDIAHNNTVYGIMKLDNDLVFDVIEIKNSEKENSLLHTLTWSQRLEKFKQLTNIDTITVEAIPFKDIITNDLTKNFYLRTVGFGAKRSFHFARQRAVKRKL